MPRKKKKKKNETFESRGNAKRRMKRGGIKYAKDAVEVKIQVLAKGAGQRPN